MSSDWGQHMNVDDIVLGATTLFCVVSGFVPSALILGRKHTRECYLLWYVFSLMFLLFLPLTVAAASKRQLLSDYLGDYAFIYDSLTNPGHELLLILGIIYIGLGPQLLTYVLSGPFGAASRPVFMRQIEATVSLSSMKFVIGAAGIELADLVARIYLGRHYPLIPGASVLLVGISVAFTIAGIHFCGMISFSRSYIRLVRRLIDFCYLNLAKRCSPGTAASSANTLFWIARLNPFRIRRSQSTADHPLSPLFVVHKYFTRHNKLKTHGTPAEDGLFSFNVGLDIPVINELRRSLAFDETSEADSKSKSLIDFRLILAPDTTSSPNKP